jgi:hypothetical protein
MTDPLVRVRRMAVVAAVALLLFGAFYTGLAFLGGEVEISDPGLEEAIRFTLQQPHGRLLQQDLDRITHLDAAGYEIEHLEDIQALPNVVTLDLSGTTPSSLAPLVQLVRLEELRLRACDLHTASDRDLHTLADSVTLRRLDLEGNTELHDARGLASFSLLRELSLRNTAVADLRFLEALTGLRHLDLRETSLAGGDLESLRGLVTLEHLNLRESGIVDIRGIENLVTLRYLNLHSNRAIVELDPLQGLTRLHTLILRNVPAGDEITVIAGMHSLQRLNIRNTGVRDLDVLAELLGRGALQEEVDIRDNPIRGSADRGPYGYDVLLPFWDTVARRYPERLPRVPTGEILINEVMTSNGTTLADGAGSYPDWIELFNPGESWADRIRGWTFPAGTSIAARSHLLLFASGASREEGSAPDVERNPELHASFTLSSGGEEIVLTRDYGRTLLDRVEVPAIPRDTSWGRESDSASPRAAWTTFLDPTPGETNRNARTYQAITFSRSGGFYDEAFELELSLADPGNDDSLAIYYTLDGSHPDPLGVRTWQYLDHETGDVLEQNTRTFRYSGPILLETSANLLDREDPSLAMLPTTVPEAEYWQWQPPENPGFRAVVVRAIAYDGEKRSNVYSATYFVDPRIGESFPLGVFSIIADPEELFGYEEGIYVPGRVYEEHREEEELWMRRPANYRERWEVPAHIEFYEPDGYRGLALDGGIRIHGGWSRSHPLKSLRLYARKDHDRRNYFEYHLFPEAAETAPQYKRLMLRSGQSLFRSHLQDAVAHTHVRPHVHVDLLEYRPVIHFINGEYWGIKNLRERFDRFYLEALYGVDPEEVIIIDGPLAFDSQLDTGRPGENRPFRELLSFVETTDMSLEEHYRRIQSVMDVDSFIDYNIVRIFSGDADGVTKHVAMWRLRRDYDPEAPPGLDGRWRWHTWDFDNAFMFLENQTMTFYGNDRTDEEYLEAYQEELKEKYQQEEIDSELLGDSAAVRSAAGIRTRDPRYTALFAGLLQNREFRVRFINRFADLMNTLYHPEVHVETIRDAAALLEPEMERHISRWGYPASVAYWRTQVERNIEFARLRPAVQRRHILEYFAERDGEISGTARLTVDLPDERGSVRVNSVLINGDMPGSSTDADGVWHGVYFTGNPLELEAIPAAGYRFTGWEVGGAPDAPDAPDTLEAPDAPDAPAESREQDSLLLELDLERDLTVRPRFAPRTTYSFVTR